MAIAFLGLTLAFVLMGTLATLAFLEVAFGWETASVSPAQSGWQPPIVQGKELLSWARRVASQCTVEKLASRPDARTTDELVTALRIGSEAALSVVAPQRPNIPTGERCHQPHTLTPPEVIEIASHLQRTRSRREVQEIAERAATNSRQLSSASTTAPRSLVCPLLGSAGNCLVSGREPLQCRAGCSLCGQKQDQASVLVEGVTQGVSEAVEAAYLDGTVCELNGALAIALRTPDVAARWATGERLFDECRIPSSKS